MPRNNIQHEYVTKHRIACTALKYDAGSCGEEYTSRNEHVGFN